MALLNDRAVVEHIGRPRSRAGLGAVALNPKKITMIVDYMVELGIVFVWAE